jgi:hypothetical protein
LDFTGTFASECFQLAESSKALWDK